MKEQGEEKEERNRPVNIKWCERNEMKNKWRERIL